MHRQREIPFAAIQVNAGQDLDTIWWADSSEMKRRSVWFHVGPGAMSARFPKIASLSYYNMQKLGNQNKMILFRLLRDAVSKRILHNCLQNVKP
jgi:hypothetical protein